MKNVVGKRDNVMAVLGAICLFYWFLDFVNIVLVLHRPTWLLWYSSSGLLMTGIALVIGNIVLIYTAFCALFFVEAMWSIDFMYVLLMHKELFGFTNYAFDAAFSKKDFFMTLYHVLIPTSLLYAVLKQKKFFKYGWLGATLFLISLVTLSYFLTGPTDVVNCIHPVSHCQEGLSFMYKIKEPFRYLLAISFVIISIYLPSNYLLLFIKAKGKTKLRPFLFRHSS